MSIDAENSPFQGIAHVMTVYSGYIYTFVIDIEHLLTARKSLESIDQYCEDLGHRGLAKVPHFGLRTGDSLWVPHGFAVVNIGVQDPELVEEEDTFCSYVCNYCLDANRAQKCGGAVMTELEAYIKN